MYVGGRQQTYQQDRFFHSNYCVIITPRISLGPHLPLGASCSAVRARRREGMPLCAILRGQSPARIAKYLNLGEVRKNEKQEIIRR